MRSATRSRTSSSSSRRSLKFIEQNWGVKAIGDHSFDARANNFTSMFDFRHPQQHTVLLRSDGSVKATHHVKVKAG